MSRKIWQPEHPTPGWLQAEKDSDLTIHLPHPDGDVPMFFRRIPAGEFRMGSRGNDPSEEPAHLVKIPHDFYLGTFPVTQAQYRAMAGACSLNPDPSHFKGDLRPVESVTWLDAMALYGKLTEAECFEEALVKSGVVLGEWQVILPSEAHWEYASSAGTETDYGCGDGEAALAEVGYSVGSETGGTHPVGEKGKHRPTGLYDMHGNVWEWYEDFWDSKAYRKRIDGWRAEAWSEEDAGEVAESNEANCYRAMRGHSGGSSFRMCGLAVRDWYSPDPRDRYYGFRLCLVPGYGGKGVGGQTGVKSVTVAQTVRAVTNAMRSLAQRRQSTGGCPERSEANDADVSDRADWDDATPPSAKRP